MSEVRVTIQTEERMTAITNMAIAIKYLAKALGIGTHVAVTGCTFTGMEVGVVVDTAEEITETMVEKL